MENTRRDVRVRSFKGGRVVFNNGSSTHDCLIRNISDGGAKLVFERVVDLPDCFDLHFLDGRQRHCIVRWRRSLEIGISFEPAEMTPMAAPVAGHHAL